MLVPPLLVPRTWKQRLSSCPRWTWTPSPRWTSPRTTGMTWPSTASPSSRQPTSRSRPVTRTCGSPCGTRCSTTRTTPTARYAALCSGGSGPRGLSLCCGSEQRAGAGPGARLRDGLQQASVSLSAGRPGCVERHPEIHGRPPRARALRQDAADPRRRGQGGQCPASTAQICTGTWVRVVAAKGRHPPGTHQPAAPGRRGTEPPIGSPLSPAVIAGVGPRLRSLGPTQTGHERM